MKKLIDALLSLFRKPDAPITVDTRPSVNFPFTESQLERAIAAASSPKRPNLEATAAALKAACVVYNVTHPLEIAHLIAQLAHESWGFTFTREIWKDTPAQLRYENHPRLGNTEPGDGKKFAGMFWIQLTGQWNHEAYASYRGISVERLHSLADDEYTNADVSLWYIAVLRKGFLTAARNDDIEAVTRSINGGLNGFEDRKRRYELVKQQLGL